MRNVQLLDKHIPLLHSHIARLEWSGTYTIKLFNVRWLDGWLMDKYLQNLSRHKTIHIDITVQKVIFSSWHQVISICPDEIVFYTIPLIYSLKHIKPSKSVFCITCFEKTFIEGLLISSTNAQKTSLLKPFQYLTDSLVSFWNAPVSIISQKLSSNVLQSLIYFLSPEIYLKQYLNYFRYLLSTCKFVFLVKSHSNTGREEIEYFLSSVTTNKICNIISKYWDQLSLEP